MLGFGGMGVDVLHRGQKYAEHFFFLTENLGENHERMKRNDNTAITNPEKLSAASKLFKFAQNTTFRPSQTCSILFSGSLTVMSKLIP